MHWHRCATLFAVIGSASCLALAQAGAPSAAPSGAPAWQVEAGASTEHLSSGAPDWRQVDLALRHRFAARSLIELTARRVRRSNAEDTEVGALLAVPLGGAWHGSFGANASPSHETLPRQAARVELARSFEGGWVGSAMLARRRFEAGSAGSGSSQIGIGVERYGGAWRGAMHLGSTRLDGGGSAPNVRLQIDRSFADERGRVGVIVARGRELEGLPATLLAPSDVVEQRVDTLAIVGAVPLSHRWAMTGEVSHVRNSDLRRRSSLPAGSPYQRSGARLGVRFDF